MTIFHPDVEYQIKKMAQTLRDADCIFIYGDGGVWRNCTVCRPQARKYRLLLHQLDELTYPIRSFLRADQKKKTFWFS